MSRVFDYDGAAMVYESTGVSQFPRRYVHGQGMDEALVWYEGTTTADRRFLLADERGSVIAVTDSGGNLLAINSYDEDGVPGAGNLGRFQYTGQKWLPELAAYDYKNRIYDPRLPRFMQTDPMGYVGRALLPIVEAMFSEERALDPEPARFSSIDRLGYVDSPNLYTYVRNDPVNNTDPTGGVVNFIAGAAAGALLAYGMQVGRNYSQGRDGISAWTDIDREEIALSAALGSLGGFGLVTAGATGTAKFVPVVGKAIRLNRRERIAAAGLGAIGLSTREIVSYHNNNGLIRTWQNFSISDLSMRASIISIPIHIVGQRTSGSNIIITNIYEQSNVQKNSK